MANVESIFESIDSSKKSKKNFSQYKYDFTFYLWKNKLDFKYGIKLEKKGCPSRVRYVGSYHNIPKPRNVTEDIVACMGLKGSLINTPEKKQKISSILQEHLITPAIRDLTKKLKK